MNLLMRRLGGDTRYLLSSFPLDLIGFVVLVTGVALGLGTAVLGVGLVVLAATLAIARRLGDAERHALPEVLGHPVAWPHDPPPPEDATIGRRVRATLGTGRYWLDLLHGVVTFPVTVVCFALGLAWWAATVIALAWPLYGWILREVIPNHTDVPQIIGLGESYLVAGGFHFAVGVLLAAVLPALMRVLALTRARFGLVLLAGAGQGTGPAQHPSGGRPEGPGTNARPLLAAGSAGASR